MYHGPASEALDYFSSIGMYHGPANEALDYFSSIGMYHGPANKVTCHHMPMSVITKKER